MATAAIIRINIQFKLKVNYQVAKVVELSSSLAKVVELSSS